MPTIRQARVGEMIKRDLAEILQKDMRDPRLALVSISGVDVTRDFTIAKVFISVIGTPKEKSDALRALQGAAGFLRGRLGGMLDLRTVPSLVFRYDTGIERGIQMFELLRQEEAALARDMLPEGQEPGAAPTSADGAVGVEEDEVEEDELDDDGDILDVEDDEDVEEEVDGLPQMTEEDFAADSSGDGKPRA